MKRICVVTGARSDFGYLLPVLRKIEADDALELSLVVTGMHLAPQFGFTVREVEASGIPIAERVDMLVSGDSPAAIAKSMSLGVAGLSEAYARSDPDILLLLGDRFETLSAAVAMVPFARPIAHIAGGESTQGAIDEVIRHAITKMSHIHFVATSRYRDRVLQMGEEPWRVVVSGAPSLDNIRAIPLLSPEELERRVGLSLSVAPLLVTFHPVTLEYERTKAHIDELLQALHALGMPVIFTYPNADTNAHVVIRAIEQYLVTHDNARFVKHLGTAGYFSLMRQAAAMVGNSSSGIIEAASFGLPVVDIGNRQKGRDRGENVLHVECYAARIAATIPEATSDAFRRRIAGKPNIYGDGNAAAKIVDRLKSTQLGTDLMVKRFHDIPLSESLHSEVLS